MKQMSQESSFSDVQLEDPDARRNSNPGPSHQIAAPVFLLFPLLLSASSFWCHSNFAGWHFAELLFTGGGDASSFQTSISPADLHGMWYPTVRRTLVCLSKLYRCIDVGPPDLKAFCSPAISCLYIVSAAFAFPFFFFFFPLPWRISL